MLCTTVFTIHSLSTNDLERKTNKQKLALAHALTRWKPSVQGLWHHLVVRKKEYCKHWNLDFLTCHSISVSVFLVPAVTSTKPMATADAVDVCKYKYLSLALENTTAISSESNSKKITHNVISIPFHSNRCLKMLHSGPPRVTNFTPGGFTSHYIHRKRKSFVFQSPSSLYPWNT